MTRRRFIRRHLFLLSGRPTAVRSLSMGLPRGEHARPGEERLPGPSKLGKTALPVSGSGSGRCWGIGYLFSVNAVVLVPDLVQAAEVDSPGGPDRGLSWQRRRSIVCRRGPSFARHSGQVYSTRFASVLRLGFYTVLLVILAHLRWATGGISTLYAITLWLVPLGTSFMFFMFLRDVYQHSNADAGRLTIRGSFSPTRSPDGPSSSMARTCTSHITSSRRFHTIDSAGCTNY